MKRKGTIEYWIIDEKTGCFGGSYRVWGKYKTLKEAKDSEFNRDEKIIKVEWM